MLVLYGFIFPPAEIHPLVVLTARLCRWEALRLDVKMALFCFLVSGVARGQCFPLLLWKAADACLRAQEKASLIPFLGREPVRDAGWPSGIQAQVCVTVLPEEA